MTDAPERIWVAPWREGDWSEGDWDDNEGKTLNDKPCIEYVRANRIKDLTAKLAKAEAGLREIVGECGCFIARTTIAEIKGESHD